MKVALVHDWLTGMRGGEKVLEALCDLFPNAPIYSLLHLQGSVSKKIESHPIETSFLQYAPMVNRYYRHYLPLFPAAIETFSMEQYDLIISSSHCVAKAAIPAPSAIHICYCHTPMRYIWSHYADYFGNHKASLVKKIAIDPVIDRLRVWDVKTVGRVNHFVANSANVAQRIHKYYGRPSSVIYPPVDVDYFTPSEDPNEDFYLMVTALVPYKRIEIAIEAFNRLGHRLKIAGTGPDAHALRKRAHPNIEFLDRVSTEELRDLYRKAAAFIQPGEEDFGISMVESLACGTPVVAYGSGGATEIVTAPESGLFFNELSASALAETVDKIRGLRFNKALLREAALRFSPERFRLQFQTFVEDTVHPNHGSQEE
jgi:glycosyltransferase involved in cell wall biosynthesis